MAEKLRRGTGWLATWFRMEPALAPSRESERRWCFGRPCTCKPDDEVVQALLISRRGSQMRTKWFGVVSLLVALGLLMAACQPTAGAARCPNSDRRGRGHGRHSHARGDGGWDPKVLNYQRGTGCGDIPTLDPAIGDDTSSIQVINEHIIGLTRHERDDRHAASPAWPRPGSRSSTTTEPRPSPSSCARACRGSATTAPRW